MPVVRFPDGSYVMDSSKIVEKLEAAHPDPSLQLNDALQQQAQEALTKILFPMVAFVFLRVHGKVVTEGEMDWFRTDREQRACQMLGRDHISLEEWERESGGEEAFKASEPGMERLSKLLEEHKKDGGPFVLGSEPCYTDLMVVGLAEFYRRIGDGAYEKLVGSVRGRHLYS